MASNALELRAAMQRLITKHGQAAVATELAAAVGVRARYYGTRQQGYPEIVAALEYMTRAAELLEAAEAKESSQ